jgi:hydrogenase maturation factor
VTPDARCEADDHCITCGDVAVALRVVRTDAAERLAWCREDGSDAGEWVDVELVGDVAPGDAVLVHAGTALVLLEHEGVVS